MPCIRRMLFVIRLSHVERQPNNGALGASAIPTPVQRIADQGLIIGVQPDFEIVTRGEHCHAARARAPRPAGRLRTLLGCGGQELIGV